MTFDLRPFVSFPAPSFRFSPLRLGSRSNGSGDTDNRFWGCMFLPFLFGQCLASPCVSCVYLAARFLLVDFIFVSPPTPVALTSTERRQGDRKERKKERESGRERHGGESDGNNENLIAITFYSSARTRSASRGLAVAPVRGSAPSHQTTATPARDPSSNPFWIETHDDSFPSNFFYFFYFFFLF